MVKTRDSRSKVSETIPLDSIFEGFLFSGDHIQQTVPVSNSVNEVVDGEVNNDFVEVDEEDEFENESKTKRPRTAKNNSEDELLSKR
jgi:hypothetical protein